MSVSIVTAAPATALSPARQRALLLGLAGAALIAGFLFTGAQPEAAAVHRAGPALTRLLRGMACLKALMMAAAVAATFWRLGSAAPPRWLVAYLAACAAMALGPGLVWGMVHLYAGSIAMNGGLVAVLVLLWRDPGLARMLAVEVARRRR